MLRAWVGVLAVQIHGLETASVVSNYDSVWIDHRHYFEDEAVAQGLGDLVLAHKKLDQALHDERAVAFARVNSSSEDYALPFGDDLLGTREVCNDQHLDRVAGRGLA